MALMAIAQDQNKSAANAALDPGSPATRRIGCRTRQRPADARATARSRCRSPIRSGRERPRGVRASLRQHRLLEAIGEEYQSPLIVTGTVLFVPHTVRLRVARRRAIRSVRSPPRRTDSHLHGTQGVHPAAEVRLHRRTDRRDDPFGKHREEILYNSQQNTPALSAYFELMDRLVPNFLTALSSQKIKGTRVLLL